MGGTSPGRPARGTYRRPTPRRLERPAPATRADHHALVIGFTDTPSGHDALSLRIRLAELHRVDDVVAAEVHDTWAGDRAARERATLDLVAARQAAGARPRTTFAATAASSTAGGLHRLAEERGATTIVVARPRAAGRHSGAVP